MMPLTMARPGETVTIRKITGRESRQLYTALSVNDSNRGYPNIAVTAVTAVTRPPCKGNLPAVFPAAVLVADTVLA